MKKSKFLTLLVFAPLLVSCGSSGAKVPKFAKYGDEIKGEAFFKAYDKKLAEGAFAKKAAIGSVVGKGFSEIYDFYEITRGKEKILSEFSDDRGDIETAIDVKNSIMRQEVSNVATGGSSSKTKTAASSGELKETQQIQIEKIKGKNYAVRLDEEKKQYSVLEEVSKKSDFNAELDVGAKAYILESYKETAGVLKITYQAADKKEQKNYKFYQNGEIFTCEYNSEETQEDKNEKTTLVSKAIVQLDFTDGKWSAKLYSKNEMTSEIKKDFVDEYGEFFVKGDVHVGGEEEVITFEFEKKEPNLKAVDISDFKRIDA